MGRKGSARGRLARDARRNRQEILQAHLGRRELVKLGLLTSAGYLVGRRGLSAMASRDGGGGDGDGGDSPPTRPFVEPLTIPPQLPDHTADLLDPPASECPNNAINPA